VRRFTNGFGGAAGFLGAVIVAGLVVMAVFAPWIS
jgi:hypothetical protein